MRTPLPEPAVRAFIVLAALTAAFIFMRRAHGAQPPDSRATISAAARAPVASAPCTVPVSPPGSVASPAKDRRSATGAASAAGASTAPRGPQR